MSSREALDFGTNSEQGCPFETAVLELHTMHPNGDGLVADGLVEV